jgi:TFIIF-interacting CTD phosphatase-like protein
LVVNQEIKTEEEKKEFVFNLQIHKIRYLRDIIDLKTNTNFSIFMDKNGNIYKLGSYCYIPKKILFPSSLEKKKVSHFIVQDKIIFFHFSDEEVVFPLDQNDIEKRLNFKN